MKDRERGGEREREKRIKIDREGREAKRDQPDSDFSF